MQIVAFSEPRWQLPKYLAVMNAAGFTEVDLSTSLPSGMSTGGDNQIYVPATLVLLRPDEHSLRSAETLISYYPHRYPCTHNRHQDQLGAELKRPPRLNQESGHVHDAMRYFDEAIGDDSLRQGGSLGSQLIFV